MPQTKDIGRLYLHVFRYPIPGAPVIERAATVEVEPPYRRGKGLCVRLVARYALVIGWWGQEAGEEGEALYEALRARDRRMAGPIEEGEDWLGEEEWPTANAF